MTGRKEGRKEKEKKNKRERKRREKRRKKKRKKRRSWSLPPSATMEQKIIIKVLLRANSEQKRAFQSLVSVLADLRGSSLAGPKGSAEPRR